MDMTLCTNEECPFKDHCGRYADNVPKNKLSPVQSYAKFEPYHDEENGDEKHQNLICDFFEIRMP